MNGKGGVLASEQPMHIRPFDFGDNPGAFNIFSTDGDHGSTTH